MIDINVNDRNELERLRYRQGQTLLGRDFRDQALIEAQLRWWHTRALHQAYGVAPGVGCELRVVQGDILTTVDILPGLAYDVFGRELILARRRSLTIPAKDDWVLLARFADGSAAGVPASLGGACLPGGAPASLVELDLVWKPTRHVGPRDGVPLAASSAGKLRQLPSRRTARSLARPPIASGATIPNATDWRPWLSPLPVPVDGPAPPPLGIQVDIDVSSAGFAETPCYFAWLDGPAWGPTVGRQVVQFFGRIEAERAAGFRFCVLVVGSFLSGDRAGGSMNPAAELVRLARELRLSVSWLGVQPTRPKHQPLRSRQLAPRGVPFQ